MNISLDCSHLVVVIDLDTQEPQYYLVPRGRHAPVAVPAGTVRRLRDALGLQLPLGEEGGNGGEREVFRPEQSPVLGMGAGVAREEPVSEAGVELLTSGTLEGPADPFGAAEG